MPLNSTYDSPVKENRISLEMTKSISQKIDKDNYQITVSEGENMEHSDLEITGKSDSVKDPNENSEDVQSKPVLGDISNTTENTLNVQSKSDDSDEPMAPCNPVIIKSTENPSELDSGLGSSSSEVTQTEKKIVIEKDSVKNKADIEMSEPEESKPTPKETTEKEESTTTSKETPEKEESTTTSKETPETVKSENNALSDSKEKKSSEEIEMNSENDFDSPSRMPGRGKKRGRSSGSTNDTPEAKKRTVSNTDTSKVKHHTHPDFSVPGIVLTLGEGDVGQLGLGEDVIERSRPGHVKLDDKIVQVVAGGMHTVCLTKEGKIITFGCNDESALGRDTSEEGSETLPAKLSLPYKVIQASAGDSHTAVLTEDGRVYAWGNFRDANGSMGLTSGGIRSEPLEMLPGETVVKIVSGGDHLVCLTDKGEIFTGGCAEQGQLGRVAECFAGRGGRKGVDSILKMGPVRCKKQGSRRRALFSDIWAGQYVTFAKELETGDIYSWGLNNYFQLGFGDMKNRFVPERVASFADLNKKWKKVQAGQHHTVLLDEEGKVYTLGRAEYGRLGIGENPGERSEPTLVKAIEDKKCIDIAAGQSVSFGLTEDGSVYSWGMGTSKQLGTGDEDDQWLPFKMAGKQLENRVVVSLAAGGQHTVLLAKDKS